eukprot:scaffold8065_cov336-Prasinococcus_capsulatus_cf.AAC.1
MITARCSKCGILHGPYLSLAAQMPISGPSSRRELVQLFLHLKLVPGANLPGNAGAGNTLVQDAPISGEG